MNVVFQLFLLAGFAMSAANSGAAPRAAEDPSAVVLSTTASAPRVKHEAPKTGKSTKKQNKATKGSSKSRKNSGKKTTQKARAK